MLDRPHNMHATKQAGSGKRRGWFSWLKVFGGFARSSRLDREEMPISLQQDIGLVDGRSRSHQDDPPSAMQAARLMFLQRTP